MHHTLPQLRLVYIARFFLLGLLLIFGFSLHAQVSIGTTNPKAFFNVPQGRTVLFGEDSSGTVNAGAFYPKLIWYGSKGALRAGAISGNASSYPSWDNANIGKYSFASGLSTTASGDYATAMGNQNRASGSAAISMGESTSATGNQSTSMGYFTSASGPAAISMGDHTMAIGNQAVSMGYLTAANGHHSVSMGIGTRSIGDQSVSMGVSTSATGQAAVSMGITTSASGGGAVSMGNGTSASGDQAVSLGKRTLASGIVSLATGYQTTASGEASTAMGANVSTNGKLGSFIIGDRNDNVYSNSADHQMMMRFDGGYVFYTNSQPYNGGTAIGVQLAHNGNAWLTVSDSTRKENFRTSNGADFLQKIAKMRLGSWNYKGQDAKTYRHYGPMAQDFFAAFGHDELGTIGEDKSINQADFDGVNLIAIQALIKKVEKLEAENSNLRRENTTLQQDTASLKSDMEQIKKQLTTLLKQ